MSFAYEDWREFYVLSGQIAVGDPTDRNGCAFINAENGEWVAMSTYGEDGGVEKVFAMRRRIADMMSRGERPNFGTSTLRESISVKSGTVFAIDRKLAWNLPPSAKVPTERLSEPLLQMLGDPYEEGKSAERSFAELCMHVGRDSRCDMQVMGELPFGAACGIGDGGKSVDIILNESRDAIAFEVHALRE